MFVVNEKNVTKKIFQKPNILRRKSKVSVTRSNVTDTIECPKPNSLVTGSCMRVAGVPNKHNNVNDANEYGCNNSKTTSSLRKKLTAEDNVHEGDEIRIIIPQETELDTNINSNELLCSEIGQFNNGDNDKSLNIESFLNDRVSKETVSNVDFAVPQRNKTTQSKNKMCIDIPKSTMDIIQNNLGQSNKTEQEQNILIDVVPALETITTDLQQEQERRQETVASTTPAQTMSIDCFTNRAVKFKCDEPNCNKGFWSEERLKKHKNSHKRQSSARPPTQIKIECPVKKIYEDGIEQKCESTFLVRSDLLKHLSTDHTPEEALYRCEVCGRRFFWASGLRAHAQSVCARGGLACAWPGCSRVFRLPCRLREHARAHTGDRPYLCNYPKCGWAFRSASKLVRHARRHTDERRHACAACGRAFLRREHLREHAARHHAPHARPLHLCTHHGCGQTFTNMSTLYMHMKKVHRKDESDSAKVATAEVSSTSGNIEENVYLVSVVESEAASEVSSAAECHAARTHCTWPLARHSSAAFLLEEDVQVEQDGSSSNIYTVRSDLFLHGNVATEEDSQHMETGEPTSAVAPLDTDLCLIDPHPTIDLMEEQLIYDDTVVDESSFRVFLMNGEELT